MPTNCVVLGITRNRAERKETVRWTVLAKEPGGVWAIFQLCNFTTSNQLPIFILTFAKN